jgi:hypothetical protein
MGLRQRVRRGALGRPHAAEEKAEREEARGNGNGYKDEVHSNLGLHRNRRRQSMPVIGLFGILASCRTERWLSCLRQCFRCISGVAPIRRRWEVQAEGAARGLWVTRMTRAAHRPAAFAHRVLWNIRAGIDRLVSLDARELDHLAPLLGFLHEELPKICGRTG